MELEDNGIGDVIEGEDQRELVLFHFIGNSSFIRVKNKHMFTEHMLDKKKWVQFYNDTRED